MRAKREAAKQAAATPAIAKRKLEAPRESEPSVNEHETPGKRRKTETNAPSHTPSTAMAAAHDTANKHVKSHPQEKEDQEKLSLTTPQIFAKPIPTPEKLVGEVVNHDSRIPTTTEASEEKTENQGKEKGDTTGDAAASELPLSAGADINFDSIFGSPTGDDNAANDLDLTLDASGAVSHGQGADAGIEIGDALNTAEDPTPLNTLLPGLDAYANATGDDFNMLNTSGPDAGAMSVPNIESNPFDLPTLDDTNDFDSFLNDNNFGQPADSEEKKGDEFLNDDAMLNLDGDLDDSWFA